MSGSAIVIIEHPISSLLNMHGASKVAAAVL